MVKILHTPKNITSSTTNPHFWHTASSKPFAILCDPHSGHNLDITYRIILTYLSIVILTSIFDNAIVHEIPSKKIIF